MSQFEAEVDPTGTLPPAERASRAEHARKAHFSRLALRSAQARRKSREMTSEAETVEAELAALGGGHSGA